MKTRIVAVDVPNGSLLAAVGRSGAYVDCYVTRVPGTVTHADFVEAFYTSWLFTIERMLLGQLASKPATDSDARRLARGESPVFSAWRVEARAVDQLLLADFTGRTKSWLMVVPGSSSGDVATDLRFGSAVVSLLDAHGNSRGMGIAFRLLLGFHKLYSRLLLRAARSRLVRRSPAGA